MKERGITIIALVISIIIIIILAAVTTNVLMGTGIMDKGTEAAKKYQGAQYDELDELDKIVEKLDELNNPNDDKEEAVLVADIIGKVDSSKNTKAKDSLGNKITIPAGFKIVANSPAGTEESKKVEYTYKGADDPCVQDGIVIEDPSTGNQFVWIPCRRNK